MKLFRTYVVTESNNILSETILGAFSTYVEAKSFVESLDSLGKYIHVREMVEGGVSSVTTYIVEEKEWRIF